MTRRKSNPTTDNGPIHGKATIGKHGKLVHWIDMGWTVCGAGGNQYRRPECTPVPFDADLTCEKCIKALGKDTRTA